MKYYFNDRDESCYPLSFYKEEMEEFPYIKEIELTEAKREIGGEMWCDEQAEFVTECGRDCKDYSPCNGRSGRCRYLKNGYIPSKKKFILNKNRLKEMKI